MYRHQGYIYMAECEGFYKIGSSKQPRTRVNDLNRQSPFDVHFVCAYRIADYKKHEKILHAKLQANHHKGEWFLLSTDQVVWVENYLLNNQDTYAQQ